MDIILDFEFTGLDNDFIKDNEIIQMKAMNCDPRVTVCVNYGTDKEIGAHARLAHKVAKYDAPKFSADSFVQNLKDIFCDDPKQATYWFWGLKADIAMLRKYDILLIGQPDIREYLWRSPFQHRLATEGNSLEVAYYIVTGKYPKIKSHDGPDELFLMHELYQVAKQYKDGDIEVMPFGFAAGMPLKQYCRDYRRNADGYRYNNQDALAQEMNEVIANFQEEEIWDYDNDY